MTEPNVSHTHLLINLFINQIINQVASSDATNIQSSITRDGDHYVLNGHKWWISGAMDPRCSVCIFMGKTDPTAPRHKQQVREHS